MTCGKKTEVYSRVVGYYRPVQQWNPGKLAEFHDRKTYKLDQPVMSTFKGEKGK